MTRAFTTLEGIGHGEEWCNGKMEEGDIRKEWLAESHVERRAIYMMYKCVPGRRRKAAR